MHVQTLLIFTMGHVDILGYTIFMSIYFEKKLDIYRNDKGIEWEMTWGYSGDTTEMYI